MLVRCPQCGSGFDVPASAVGKQGRCRGCQHVFTIPATADPATPSSSATPAASAAGAAPRTAAPPPLPSAGRRTESPSPARGTASAGATPPPLPPAGGGAQKSSSDILSGYESSSKPVATEVGAKLKRGAQLIQQRAHAIKLKHEVHGLRTSVDAQLEMLAKLVLQHNPAGLDIAEELSALSECQDAAAQKRATLDSLKQGKGGGAVVKQFKAELAALQDRQHQLMIAVGAKAEAARSDLPGAAGSYSAIDSLRAPLHAKEAELATLEAQLGPIWEGGAPSMRSYRRPLIIAGAAAGGLLAVYLLWTLLLGGLFSPGLPGWAKQYVTQDTAVVVYANIEKLRGEDIWSDFKGLYEVEVQRGGFVAIKPDDVSVLVGVGAKEPDVMIFRTGADMSLDDVVKSREKAVTYKDYQYKHVLGGACAKLDERTFAVAESEDELKGFLADLKSETSGKMSDDLKDALSNVAGSDFYIAGMPPTEALPIEGVNQVGLGVTVSGDSVKLTGFARFARERDAKRASEDYEDFVAKQKIALDKATPRMKQELAKMVDMFEALKLKHSGDRITIRGEWKTEQLKGMAKQAFPFGL